ncbi:MAG: hypothetical protein OHK0028_20090 [Deltaproteobacteria bacterium]
MILREVANPADSPVRIRAGMSGTDSSAAALVPDSLIVSPPERTIARLDDIPTGNEYTETRPQRKTNLSVCRRQHGRHPKFTNGKESFLSEDLCATSTDS